MIEEADNNNNNNKKDKDNTETGAFFENDLSERSNLRQLEIGK